MYKSFLIKYGEIAIKGKNRYLFEEALVCQIRYALKEAEGEFHVRRLQGRIYVDAAGEYDYDEVMQALSHVFGIVGICPVVLLKDEGFERLAEDVIAYMDKVYPDKHLTFKVHARRARKNYPMDSMELNAALGEKILEAFPEISTIRTCFYVWRSARRSICILWRSKGRAVCRWEQTERQCCCCPAESTVRQPVI